MAPLSSQAPRDYPANDSAPPGSAPPGSAPPGSAAGSTLTHTPRHTETHRDTPRLTHTCQPAVNNSDDKSRSLTACAVSLTHSTDICFRGGRKLDADEKAAQRWRHSSLGPTGPQYPILILLFLNALVILFEWDWNFRD